MAPGEFIIGRTHLFRGEDGEGRLGGDGDVMVMRSGLPVALERPPDGL